LLRGPLEWHYLRTKFHENLPRGPKVISGGHTDRQNGDLISLSFFESRLQIRDCGTLRNLPRKYGRSKSGQIHISYF
jgi:hypothetical protein